MIFPKKYHLQPLFMPIQNEEDFKKMKEVLMKENT